MLRYWINIGKSIVNCIVFVTFAFQLLIYYENIIVLVILSYILWHFPHKHVPFLYLWSCDLEQSNYYHSVSMVRFMASPWYVSKSPIVCDVTNNIDCLTSHKEIHISIVIAVVLEYWITTLQWRCDWNDECLYLEWAWMYLVWLVWVCSGVWLLLTVWKIKVPFWVSPSPQQDTKHHYR